MIWSWAGPIAFIQQTKKLQKCPGVSKDHSFPTNPSLHGFFTFLQYMHEKQSFCHNFPSQRHFSIFSISFDVFLHICVAQSLHRCSGHANFS